MIMSHRLKNCWDLYRILSKQKFKNDFNEWRREICEINGFKIKGVSKMSRREIEMEMARQLFR
jgi:AAA15 family ATPase/GTPase